MSKVKLLQTNSDAITAKVEYESFETDLFHEESAGFKKLLAMATPFVDSIVNSKVLICDGIETDLHREAASGLLKSFMSTNTNRFPQVLFTTHDTGLLNLDLFRRDQIWFTELRNNDRSTDLYSLAEIKNVRKEENFEKGYISGKYGSIPKLNLDLTEVFLKSNSL